MNATRTLLDAARCTNCGCAFYTHTNATPLCSLCRGRWFK